MVDTEILQDILTDHKLVNTQREELEKAIQLLNHSDDIDKACLICTAKVLINHTFVKSVLINLIM